MNVCGAVFQDSVSPYLKLYITDLLSGDFVAGYIGEGSTASLSGEWSSPFKSLDLASLAGASAAKGSGMLADAAGKLGGKTGAIGRVVSNGISNAVGSAAGSGTLSAALSAYGYATAAQINSLMVWEGQQPPQFAIALDLIAHSNPYLEVQLAIKVLEQMCSPQLDALTPGGRPPNTVTFDIGRRIKLTDVIITDVSYDLSAPKNAEGYFLENRVSLTCCGSTMYNKDEFDSMFI